MSIESVMPSNHLILSFPLLFLPSIFPNIRVFSNESALHIRWPKYWSFSFNISPSTEYPGLISFRMDWLDLLAVQGTLKSLQHQACSPSVTAAMASKQLFRALVSAQWVAEALRAPQAGQPLRLLDASWYLAKLGRDARREFEERHIPGAAFFDIDQCSDRTSPYDHMLPSAAHFSEYAGRLGVGAATHVVVYDASDQGLYAAPRVWWMFRVFGHRTVSLLDGGLRNWLRQGLPLSSGKSRPQPAEFHAVLDPAYIKTYEDIKENLESRRFQVVDARAAGRFRGTEPEPRDGIEPGHIPGTINIPFTDFLTEDGLEKSPEEIRRLFQDKKVDLSLPLVATCGSGVTACHVALGAYLCGKPDVPIYDGSWVEWYMRAQPEDIISEGRGKIH
ncbi:3-mercaptopyruvate sulfurtransferase isoform X3 [Bos indicus]|uniref:Sulfurtransferase n=3 Tax=Bos TaxID=9903 RepID=A0AAA9SGF2_BOVIN